MTTRPLFIVALVLMALVSGVLLAQPTLPVPVPVVPTPPPPETMIIDKVGNLGATLGANSILAALLWYFFAKREPEREERTRELIKQLNDQNNAAQANQRSEFLETLAEQRKLTKEIVDEHREARALSRQVIDNNTKALVENTVAMRDATRRTHE